MSTQELLCGRYVLGGLLGRGGAADVCDGWDTRLGRPVAIKLLRLGLGVHADADNRRRFADEACIAATLSHPNIVAVHDRGEHAGTPFIVMERLPGHTLIDVLDRGPFPPAATRTLMGELVAGLAAAHRGGILHRDVKPGNILFTVDGSAKIADFGIAKTTDLEHTVAGQVMGTAAYLSPDRILGHQATPSDDLYAVGVVGYEALTGRRAFPQDNLGALSHAIVHQPPPPVAALRPDVEPALAALVDRAMAPRAEWRFETAEQMLAALSDRQSPSSPSGPVVVGQHRPATRVMTATYEPLAVEPGYAPRLLAPPERRTRRRVAMLAVVAAILVATTAIVVASLAHRASTSTPTDITGTPTTMTTPPNAVSTADAPTSAPPPPAPPRKHGRGHGHDR